MMAGKECWEDEKTEQEEGPWADWPPGWVQNWEYRGNVMCAVIRLYI